MRGDCLFCWYWWNCDHHCLNLKDRGSCLFCWYWWNCWPDIGGIVDHHCLNLKVRGSCLFCWYWWNCWPDIDGIVDHQCLNLKVRGGCWYLYIISIHVYHRRSTLNKSGTANFFCRRGLSPIFLCIFSQIQNNAYLPVHLVHAPIFLWSPSYSFTFSFLCFLSV